MRTEVLNPTEMAIWSDYIEGKTLQRLMEEELIKDEYLNLWLTCDGSAPEK